MDIDEQKIKSTIDKIFELYGGKKAFEEDSQNQLKDFNEKWSQDEGLLGRILRSHLVVEHYLTVWLQYINPSLGSIDNAKLSFSHKVSLIGESDLAVKDLVPGIRRLNKIRNRVAHNLSVTILPEDEDALKSSRLFKAMIDLDEDLYCGSSATGIELLEGFAKYAAGLLQAGSHENTNIWREAFEPWAFDNSSKKDVVSCASS